MIEQYLGISTDKLVKAGWETLYMVNVINFSKEQKS